MKTETLLLLGAGAAAVYFIAKKKKAADAAKAVASAAAVAPPSSEKPVVVETPKATGLGAYMRQNPMLEPGGSLGAYPSVNYSRYPAPKRGVTMGQYPVVKRY